MIEIILVNTRQENFQEGIFSLGNSRKNQPLDLALIAAVLEKNKFKVKIIDANLLRISHQNVALEIAKDKPKIVVINTASLDRWECPLPTVEEPARLATAIKNKYPQALLVAIGPHGTTTPEWVLQQCPDIDIVVHGEPELAVLKISQSKKRPKNKILEAGFIDDLDSLPLPAYHLLPMKKYGPLGDHFNGKNFEGETWPFSIILTSRGCPGQCTLCFKKMYQPCLPAGRTCRFRSPKNVVAEIELLIKKFGVKAIYIQDLSFCLNQQRVITICQEIIRRRLKFTWGGEARFDNVSLNLLKIMKRAGCSFINFGLESGSEKIISLCKKNIPLKVIEKAIADCRTAKISVGCFKLLGLPGETKETFIETLAFMLKNKIEIPYPFPLNLPLPYPGTELHQQAEKEFKRKISWEETPKYAGRIATKFFDEVSPEEIQKITYEYKLKQEEKPKDKHYFKLLFKKILASAKNRSFSKT